jgi:autotransporter-associated beta strand protein
MTGLTIAREISGSGRGPGAANAAGAIMSIGNNTFTGGITLGNGSESRLFASSGITTLQGDTYLTGGNGMVFFGNGNIIASGVVSGMDTGYDRFIKAGLIYDSTLWLQNSANSLVGTVRIDGGSIRVATNAALGLSLSDRAVDINNGRLEVRTDDPAGFATRKVYIRDNTNSNLYLDHALGSELVGQTVQFGQLRAFVINTLFHIYGRNGYGATFQPAAQGTLGYYIGGGGSNGATINNYSNGLVTLNGDLWRQTDGTARTLTFGGNGDVLVTGSILAPTTIAHNVTKGGTGTLTLLGTSANFVGSFNATGGTVVVRGMGAFNAAVASGALQLNGAAVSYLGATGTGAGETTTKLINLTGTTGAGFLYANQSGSAPTALILSNGIAATGAGIKNFYLGGDAPAAVINEIRGVIQDNTGTNKTSLVKMGSSTWLYNPAAANYSSTAPTGITVTSGGAANTNSFVVSSATGIVPGMTVTGTNVPGATIVTGVSGTTVTVNNTISTAVAAATALTFGTIANFTGNVTVAGGTLQLRPTASTGNGSDVITNASTLTFGADAIQGAGFAGGVFEYQGSAAGGILTETIGALSVNAGLGVLRVTANSGTPTLNLASYATRAAGAALRIEQGVGTGLQFALAPAAVSNGLLSGTYLVDPTSGAIDFVATPLANTNVAALGAATALPATVGSATTNYLLTGTLAVTGALSANSVRIAGGANLTLSGGNFTLTAASATALGGLVHDNAGGAATIGGSYSLSTSGASQELFFVTGGTANANALTISARIANGAGGITKAGTGTLVLTGSNLFTGAVTVDEGTLRVSGATPGLMGMPVAATVNALRQGTTLELSSAGEVLAPYAGIDAIPILITALTNGSGAISNLTVGAQAIQFAGSGTGVLSSVLANGAGKLTVMKSGSGIQALTGLNTYTGATIINGGTLVNLTAIATDIARGECEV